jgi:hypothetical protein
MTASGASGVAVPVMAMGMFRDSVSAAKAELTYFWI